MEAFEETNVVQMIVEGIITLSRCKVKVSCNFVDLELSRDATALGSVISDLSRPVLVYALLNALHAGRAQVARLVGGKDGGAAVAAYIFSVGTLRLSLVAAAAVAGGAAQGWLGELAKRLVIGAEPDP